MKYDAIFFDRDGTLTYFNPEKEKWTITSLKQLVDYAEGLK